jgi:hypothetical protein
MGRYLINGVVYADAAGTQPVGTADPYYYSAQADIDRQTAEQAAQSQLDGMLAANANALAVGGQPPFPDVLTPAQLQQQGGGTVPNPADALGAITSGSKWLMIGVGALVLVALLRSSGRR